MSLKILRCKTCGEAHPGVEHFDYQLKIHKSGKVKQCKECYTVSHPDRLERTYWFCKRECLDKFLKKYKDENFKDIR